MTTITLKIDEHTKGGKALMTLIDFLKDSNEIEIIEPEMTAKEIAFMKDLESCLIEVKAIKEGKSKGTPLKDLL